MLAGPGVRPPLRDGRGAGAARAAAPSSPTTRCGSIAAGLRSLGPLPDEALDASLAATRRRLRDAVSRNEVDGATGKIRFDAHGDRRQGVALYSVEKTPLGPPRALVRGWLGEP